MKPIRKIFNKYKNAVNQNELAAFFMSRNKDMFIQQNTTICGAAKKLHKAAYKNPLYFTY
jgi:hypothetical protein